MTKDNLPDGHSTAEDDALALSELGYTSQLNRSMSMTDVVIFGLIYMVPLATLPVFGIVYNFSGGMAALVYLVAAFAMFFSALSYKEMAKRYPIAGSVYSYVRIGINHYVGFIAGWVILLDYLLLPALLAVFAAAAMTAVVPAIPAFAWVIAFVVLAALVVLRGINLTARTNQIFLAIQLIVFAIFVVGAVVAVLHGRAEFSWDPIYRSSSFSWSIVFGAIPIAALSFVGFDAISTLNEEAKGGGKTVSKATMIVLFSITGLFFLQVYLASLFVPTGTTFADGDPTNNAFYDIAGEVVGPWFKTVITLTSALVAIFANSIASQATSSRLIFSMARDGKLPGILAKVSDQRQVPTNAILLIAGLSLIIGVLGSENQALLTTLVTFGALTAYILLHIAVLVHFAVRERSRHLFLHVVSPVVGIAVLGYALWSADVHAKILGVSWIILGAIIGASTQIAERKRERASSPSATVGEPTGAS